MLLLILLYVMSICEVECGKYEIANNSTEMQHLDIKTTGNECVNGITLEAGEKDTITLTEGKFRLIVTPAGEYYRVTAR